MTPSRGGAELFTSYRRVRPKKTFFIAAPVEQAPEPECREDYNCGTQEVCVDQRCVRPCPEQCKPGQECRVEQSHPVKTVSCACPDDTFLGQQGYCESPPSE